MVNKQDNKYKGQRGEDIALLYLKKIGYQILQRNYKRKTGEVDIIAQVEDTIIFTEVKYRQSWDYGAPSQAVNYKKQKHIIKTAMFYIQEFSAYEMNVRFDVLEIVEEIKGKPYINLIPNAFQIKN